MDSTLYSDLNELPLLEKCFSIENLRHITTSRKKYEEELSNKKELSTFISYIKHEMELWKKVKSQPHKGTQELHKIIARKIIKLHKIALSYYKESLSLWLSFIKFCIRAGYTNLLSEEIAQMMTYHTDKQLWLLAAKWEMDECENLDKALSYLYRGLHYHPKETSLYTEIFRMELESSNYVFNTNNLQELREESENQAMKLYSKVQKEIPNDANLYITLLKIASEHKFAAQLQTEIAQYLIKSFPKDESVCFYLAQRELEGYHLTENNQLTIITPPSSQTCIENLINKFEHAVKIISTESMWTKYLNTLLDLYENKTLSTEFLKQAYMQACNKAHESRLMSDEHYIKWIEYLQNDPQLIQILEDATKARPNCVQLWVARVRYHISKNELNKVEEIFDEAIHILKDESIQIWRMKIQFYEVHLNCRDKNKIESIYQAGLNFSPTIANLLKAQYLHWVMLFKLIETAREEYKRLAVQEPFCIELHKKMVELESLDPHPNEENLEFISQLATTQFGEVWTEYVMEEIGCGVQWKKDIFMKYFLKKQDIS